MMTHERLRWSAGVLAVLTALGCAGPAGPPGPPGPPGDGGALPSSTSTVSGTVTDGTHPLADVVVSASPGAASTTTDGKGAFAFPALELGAYELTFHLAGYVDQTITVAVSPAGPTKVTVALAVDPEAGVSPSVAVSDQLLAGYGATVTLPAVATGNGPFTYAWTQTRGPTATLTGADTATPSFTTQDFLTAIGPTAVADARFDTLGIDPDQALDYTFQLVVTDAGGRATTSTVTVNATRPTLGLRMAPLGVPVWLQGNGPIFPLPPVPPATAGVAQSTWSWTLDTTGAPGSKATITDPTSQFPSFVPDVTGTYAITETVSSRTMNVYAGTWEGEMTDSVQSVCTMCHSAATDIAPDLFPPWKGTKHYSSLQRGIEGDAGPGFTEPCLSCHVVGSDKTASNDGFDDVLPASGWTYPTTLEPGNWSALLDTPNLGQLAGIQCESCHGPQNGGVTGPHANVTNLDVGARINWSTSVCASCHQESPQYDAPSQWALGPHADLALAVSEGSVEKSPNAAHCGRCHAAQGYARYVAGLTQGYYAYLTSDGKPLDTGPTPANHVATTTDMLGFGMGQATVQSPTCSACHDPHDATNPAQLRVYDAVAALPNGLTNVSGMGAGMVCLTCHNSRNGEHTDTATQVAGSNGILTAGALTGFTAPHAAAQGDVLFGFNAYFGPRLDPSPHLAVADTCAGCHYALTTASDQAVTPTTNHSFVVDDTLCASCHSSNVDGKSLKAAYKAEIDQLRALFAAKTLAPIAAALQAAPSATLVARAYDPSTGLYSSASASTLNVVVDAVPTAVSFAPIAATPGTVYGPSVGVGLTLTLPAPVAVQWVDAGGNPVGAPAPVTNLTVPIASLELPPPASGPQLTPFNAPTANAASVQILYKAYWNVSLLNNDNTLGVHNPGFYDAVLTNTSAALAALP